MVQENVTNDPLSILDALLKEIRKRKKRLSNDERIIKSIIDSLKKNDYGGVKKNISNRSVKEIINRFPETASLFSTLKARVDYELVNKYTLLSRDLQRLHEDSTLQVNDWFPFEFEGSLPEFTVNKIIRIKVDKGTFSVRVNKLRVDNLDYNKIREAVLSENNRLFHRDYNPGEFIERLFEGYKEAILLEGSRVGDLIPIRKVYRQMILLQQKESFFINPIKNNFKPYLFDEFGVDISRLLLKTIIDTREGYKLELNPSRNQDNSIYLTMPNGDCLWMGLISFSGIYHGK